jgi:cob(I)alamin adenosyltransferase
MNDHRIYTRTGDAGTTGLFGGGRVAKSHPRVEAYGEVDELNAVIGWAVAVVHDTWIRDRLVILQADLFAIGAHLASPPAAAGRKRPALPELPDGRPSEIESWIDGADVELDPLRSFVLPGGAPGAAALHFARTVCRRAERRVVALAADEPVDPVILVILNRASDFLFAAARLENRRAGQTDVIWDPSGRHRRTDEGG